MTVQLDRSRLRRPRGALVLAVVGLFAACSGSEDSASAPAAETTVAETSPTTSSTTTTTTEPDPCATSDERPVSVLFDCFSPMVAFVETPESSGSGVVLDTGHVVTNAHVVDPYEFVTVSLPDGTVHDDVEVLGVEYAADVAVLGPIDTDLDGLTFSEDAVDQGQDLVLIGYPLTGEEPVPTVVSGILSRERSLPTFDQTILQIDAAVAPGDSGGVVLTRRGEVVGLTTGFFGSSALAASGPDVVAATEQILDRDAKTWERIPPLRTDWSFSVLGEASLIAVPEADQDSITISVDGDAAIVVASLDVSLPIAIAGIGSIGDEFVRSFVEGFESEVPPEPLLGIEAEDFVVEPDPDGTFTVEVAPGIPLRVVVFGGEERLSVELDAPTAEYRDPDPFAPIVSGAEKRNTLNTLDLFDSYGILLQAGDVVSIEAESPMDVVVTAISPSGEQVVVFDDGGGEFGLDPTGTFTAEESGQYFVEVGTYDAIATYRVVVDVEPASTGVAGG